MSVTIEHNGYELRFWEDDESWSCQALELRASSLKALKAKIGKVEGAARKVSIPVIVLGHNESVSRGTITMIAKRKDWDIDYTKREGGFRRIENRTLPTVWVNKVRGNSVERKKVSLSSCIEPTEGNLVLIQAARDKFAEAKRIEDEAKEMLAKIPRLSIEDLEQRGAEEDPTGDEE